MSLQDFYALELLSVAFPGEAWGLTAAERKTDDLPSKADDYHHRLQEGRAQHPPDQSEGHQVKTLTTAQKVQALDAFADKLLESAIPVADRLIHLRHHAGELGLNIRDNDLQRKLWEARRRSAGAIEMLAPGMAAKVKPETWAWKGLILAGDSTLLASDPKVGKTTLLIEGSYAKLTGPLALKEASADFSGPLGDLQEAVAPYRTTLVVIHHSGRSRAGGDNAHPSATRKCRWWTPSAAASTTPHHDPTMWAR